MIEKPRILALCEMDFGVRILGSGMAALGRCTRPEVSNG